MESQIIKAGNPESDQARHALVRAEITNPLRGLFINPMSFGLTSMGWGWRTGALGVVIILPREIENQ